MNQNPKKTVTFVCTGNACRSPMAEYLFRALLGPDSDWTVQSAGTATISGASASDEAIAVMREEGIDMSRHASQRLSRELVDASDVLVVMTADHREQIRRSFRGAEQKTFLLKSFGSDSGGDIYDPVGLSMDVYRGAKREIKAALPDLASFLRKLEVRGSSGA